MNLLRYIVCPSAYKGSFSPTQVANAICEGIRRYDANAVVELAPIADGGDGTIEALHVAVGGDVHAISVHGPTGQQVQANWLKLGTHTGFKPGETGSVQGTGFEPGELISARDGEPKPPAIVELASACGLAYIAPDHLAPLDATTFGAGEVLKHCLSLGERNIVLAVGGSASTDGGIGILHALGARFFDSNGAIVAPGGRNLCAIASCDLSALTTIRNELKIRVATDVVNPLLGEHGAAAIFAPQKGASDKDVHVLEKGLQHFADFLEGETGKRARELAGAGAAGGVPFGLAVALDATIIPGFKWIAELISLEERIRNADLVISAEGKLDSQSISGKAAGELADLCRKNGKPLWMVPALAEENIDWTEYGIQRVSPAAAPGVPASLEDISNAVFKALSSS